MYLSELYEIIGRILEKNGDMPIVRHPSLKIDGIVNSGINNFVNYSKNNFSILKDYNKTPENEQILTNKYFVINIP